MSNVLFRRLMRSPDGMSHDITVVFEPPGKYHISSVDDEGTVFEYGRTTSPSIANQQFETARTIFAKLGFEVVEEELGYG